MKKEILRTERLTVECGDRRAEEIDLLLREGECLVLAGLNNTPVEDLCGLFGGRGAVREGRLYLYGQQVRDTQHQTMWQQKVYFIEPDPPVFRSASLDECLFLMRNVSLGKGRIPYRAMRQQAQALFDRYGLPFSPGQPHTSLTYAEQVLFALLWAVSQGARLIVLYGVEKDLAAPELERLVRLITQMKAEGATFLIGSSHAHVFFPAADQVAVLRRGRICKKLRDKAQFPLYMQFMQPELSMKPDTPARPELSGTAAECLRYERLSAGRGAEFSLTLHRGEVLVLTAPDSAWQETLWQQLTFCGGRAALFLDGQPAACHSVQQLVEHQVGVWADSENDRQLLQNLSYGDNLLLPALRRISRGGFYERQAHFVLADEEFFGYAVPSDQPLPEKRFERLRLLASRWAFFNPRAMLMWNLFSNADLEESQLLTRFVRRLAARGTAVLLLEVSPRECLSLCGHLLLIDENGSAHLLKPEMLREDMP